MHNFIHRLCGQGCRTNTDAMPPSLAACGIPDDRATALGDRPMTRLGAPVRMDNTISLFMNKGTWLLHCRNTQFRPLARTFSAKSLRRISALAGTAGAWLLAFRPKPPVTDTSVKSRRSVG